RRPALGRVPADRAGDRRRRRRAARADAGDLPRGHRGWARRRRDGPALRADARPAGALHRGPDGRRPDPADASDPRPAGVRRPDLLPPDDPADDRAARPAADGPRGGGRRARCGRPRRPHAVSTVAAPAPAREAGTPQQPLCPIPAGDAAGRGLARAAGPVRDGPRGGGRRARCGRPRGPHAVSTMTAPAPAVAAVNLQKRFGQIHAVDGIDLALSPGRIYGLLGPNGSGKTTLIRLLTGLAHASGGEARILGTKMPSRKALGTIGYMPQAEALYPELSVGENLGFFARLESHADRSSIDRVLDLVELRDRKGTPALELSGGMRRRLSLAVTLVHEPTVLFLDEPTVGVDPALRVQFWTHFRRLAAQGPTSTPARHPQGPDQTA